MAKAFWQKRNLFIVGLSLLALGLYVVLRYALHSSPKIQELSLVITLLFCGVPLIIDIVIDISHGEFGADILAALSIIVAALLHQYLAGTIVVMMLSGGAVLENYAVSKASSVLQALSRRMPTIAHRKEKEIKDIDLKEIAIGDRLVIFPHEICPVDGVVTEGHGTMDESYLTGEPFEMSKTPGSLVLSGAINGEVAMTIRVSKLPVDSRYAKITEVMRTAETKRPHLRRMADKLGMVYTPLSLVIAFLAWYLSGESIRFLAVLVIATPCPLIIGIPVAIIGSISLCAKRGIIVKNPIALEQVEQCRTAIFDKTGTLTYGEPLLVEQICHTPFDPKEILFYAASLERYSKHPLAQAIVNKAKTDKIALEDADQISEKPGEGLRGLMRGADLQITDRKSVIGRAVPGAASFPRSSDGMECFIVVNNVTAALYRFRDKPREDGLPFIRHLGPKHQFEKTMIVSGDRESEVKYLAEQTGITNIFAEKEPEEKLAIVREETKKAKTLYIGDGINDAPALMAATVGMAIGQNSDITSEAAGVVIMDSSLLRVDEFFHISKRMRTIALQSAVGGMGLSLVGMVLALMGYLPPVSGAVVQEVIDLLAILNALRVAIPPRVLHDFAE